VKLVLGGLHQVSAGKGGRVTLGSNFRARFADYGAENFAFQVQPLHLESGEFPLTPRWLSGLSL
jgi:hypothetical protein